jgi:hypothetical protein
MTPEERAQVFAKLSVVFVTSFTPEQANNEIRNAMLHCARVCAATTTKDAEENIDQVRWHIGLAKRDCFKICILKTREKIEKILDITEYKFKTIKTADRKRLREIALKTKALVKRAFDPTTRQDQKLTAEFESAYDDISDFEEHVLTTYPVTWTARSAAYGVWLRISKIGNRVGLWIVGAIIIAILASPIMPESMKAYYVGVMKFLFCRIAADPFCN